MAHGALSPVTSAQLLPLFSLRSAWPSASSYRSCCWSPHILRMLFLATVPLCLMCSCPPYSLGPM